MVAVSRAETKNAVEAADKKVLQGTGKTARLLGRILLFCCDLCSVVNAVATGLFKGLAAGVSKDRSAVARVSNL
jgi:hypothetical protein